MADPTPDILENNPYAVADKIKQATQTPGGEESSQSVTPVTPVPPSSPAQVETQSPTVTTTPVSAGFFDKIKGLFKRS
ncbi:MAG: hypothetical protein V1808_04445 [Candidatus Daviesbacteria bacterium]